MVYYIPCLLLKLLSRSGSYYLNFGYSKCDRRYFVNTFSFPANCVCAMYVCVCVISVIPYSFIITSMPIAPFTKSSSHNSPQSHYYYAIERQSLWQLIDYQTQYYQEKVSLLNTLLITTLLYYYAIERQSLW